MSKRIIKLLRELEAIWPDSLELTIESGVLKLHHKAAEALKAEGYTVTVGGGVLGEAADFPGIKCHSHRREDPLPRLMGLDRR